MLHRRSGFVLSVKHVNLLTEPCWSAGEDGKQIVKMSNPFGSRGTTTAPLDSHSNAWCRQACWPYVDERPAGDRIRVTMPELLVGETSATTLALVVHELRRTRSSTGRSRRRPGSSTFPVTPMIMRLITWRERGGP